MVNGLFFYPSATMISCIFSLFPNPMTQLSWKFTGFPRIDSQGGEETSFDGLDPVF